jgi:hypothetical protein
MISISSAIATLKRAISMTLETNERFDEVKMNQGLILAELKGRKESKNLQDYEFKVFSQWGEDGIIQRLTSVIDIENKTFIEFGVEDFSESNCRFLMMKDNWSGFVIDGSASNIKRLKESYFYWKYELAALDSFITRENINDLLAKSGFGEHLGILSIDLDGNDYYVLEAIRFFKPRILICEYNAVFGAERKISVPYDAGFAQDAKHYSHLYFGASLGAVTHVAKNKGYSLVGTNTAGANAFFVRDDLLNGQLEVLCVEKAFSMSKFRSSRDEAGGLSYVSGNDRIALIKGLPVFNVVTNLVEAL